MGKIGTELRRLYDTSVLGNWSRVQLSLSPENLTSNAKDITLNVDNDTPPFVGGTISVPINVDNANKVDMKLFEETFLNKKEEKEMDILDLYKERKNQLLMNNFYKEKQEIIEEDEIQKIKEEMIKQINIILDNEERNEKFETLVPGIAKNVFTKQTQEKINKLEIDLDLEKDKLYNTIQEVKALFEMTEDYQERMKILKKYDILDKNGKLSV